MIRAELDMLLKEATDTITRLNRWEEWAMIFAAHWTDIHPEDAPVIGEILRRYKEARYG